MWDLCYIDLGIQRSMLWINRQCKVTHESQPAEMSSKFTLSHRMPLLQALVTLRWLAASRELRSPLRCGDPLSEVPAISRTEQDPDTTGTDFRRRGSVQLHSASGLRAWSVLLIVTLHASTLASKVPSHGHQKSELDVIADHICYWTCLSRIQDLESPWF